MADRAAYHRLRDERPDLFVEDPAGGFRVLTEDAEIDAAEAAAVEAAGPGMPREWFSVGVVAEDQYVYFLRDAVEFPGGGQRGTYDRIVGRSTGAGVVVLPRWRDRVVLIRHARHATRRTHLEIPRGFGASGVPPAEKARDELREEIGATAERLVALGPIYPDTGFTASPVELFFAEIDSYGAPEIGEGIDRIVLATVAEVEQMIADAEITDGFLLAAFCRARARRLI